LGCGRWAGMGYDADWIWLERCVWTWRRVGRSALNGSQSHVQSGDAGKGDMVGLSIWWDLSRCGERQDDRTGVNGKGDKDGERIGEDSSGREKKRDETTCCAAKRDMTSCCAATRASTTVPTDTGAAADTSQSRQRRGRTALQGQHQRVRAESEGGSCIGSGVVDASSVSGLRCPSLVYALRYLQGRTEGRRTTRIRLR
jgi:hypothetical protein